MINRLLTLALLAFTLPAVGFAQINWDIKLPDLVMQQVVSRILRYEFKSPRRERKIRIDASHVKQEWLPSIRNINFELVGEEEAAHSNSDLYSFFQLGKVENRYEVDVGWSGDCDGEGPVWRFIVHGERVRLWRTNLKWGSACGGVALTTWNGLDYGYKQTSRQVRLADFPDEPEGSGAKQ